MNGKAVKLVKGNLQNKKFEEDALALARKFSIYPQINLIDLNAAFGNGDNNELIRKICKICNCNIGGGIRTIEQAYKILKIGANKIIIGTKANKKFLKKLPKEKIIVAVDSKQGKIVNKAWTNKTSNTAIEKVIELQNYCSEFLYTYVDKEGTMEEIDFDTILKIREITNNKLQYAGGISNKEQVLKLAKYNIDTVIGMAYYENKINYNEMFVSLLDFKKNKGMIPTIVKDENDQILMLAYSSKDSVLKAITQRKGIYFSRSRKKLWIKGETSKNTQELKRVQTDCDNDTLIYTVIQKKVACHTGQYSCFSDKKFELNELLSIIKSKRNTDSFTDKLLKNEKELKKKILEESNEVINYIDKDNLKWEIADLIYFITVLMAKNNLDYKDIFNDLKTRNYIKTIDLNMINISKGVEIK